MTSTSRLHLWSVAFTLSAAISADAELTRRYAVPEKVGTILSFTMPIAFFLLFVVSSCFFGFANTGAALCTLITFPIYVPLWLLARLYDGCKWIRERCRRKKKAIVAPEEHQPVERRPVSSLPVYTEPRRHSRYLRMPSINSASKETIAMPRYESISKDVRLDLPPPVYLPRGKEDNEDGNIGDVTPSGPLPPYKS